MEPVIIESCHSTWVVDFEQSRFKRILKGIRTPRRCTGLHELATLLRLLSTTRPRSRFSSFSMPEGTRLLRSWRHVEHCTQCGGEATSELSLDELRAVALS